MNLDAVATDLLDALTPSGTLTEFAVNVELDELQNEFDTIQARITAHLSTPSLVSRIEDDLALAAGPLGDGVTALEKIVVPMLALLLAPIPGGSLISLGIQVAVAVGVSVYEGWSRKRIAAMGRPT